MLVIYKDLRGYCVTDIDNYNASAMDARKVFVMDGFTSANDIIDYFCTYCNKTKNDFVVEA